MLFIFRTNSTEAQNRTRKRKNTSWSCCKKWSLFSGYVWRLQLQIASKTLSMKHQKRTGARRGSFLVVVLWNIWNTHSSLESIDKVQQTHENGKKMIPHQNAGLYM